MANELHDLRISKNLSTMEIVAAVQVRCPGFDKTLLSKVGHADKYGVTLKRDVMDALIEQFAPDEKAAIKRRRDGQHRLTCRISCRLENEGHAALQQLIEAEGYGTAQDWLTDIVRRYIEEQRGAK